MNNKEEKRAKFREMARHDQIKIASRFAEEYAQPFLPLINDIVPDVEKYRASAEKGRFSRKPPKPNAPGCPYARFIEGPL
jgi:hypothetical protein